jgi:hypothetical protein
MFVPGHAWSVIPSRKQENHLATAWEARIRCSCTGRSSESMCEGLGDLRSQERVIPFCSILMICRTQAHDFNSRERQYISSVQVRRGGHGGLCESGSAFEVCLPVCIMKSPFSSVRSPAARGMPQAARATRWDCWITQQGECLLPLREGDAPRRSQFARPPFSPHFFLGNCSFDGSSEVVHPLLLPTVSLQLRSRRGAPSNAASTLQPSLDIRELSEVVERCERSIPRTLAKGP